MAPKKAAAAAAPKKGGSAPAHASYKEMIKEAILKLKERNGSSRIAIKKYIQSNNNLPSVSGPSFDSQFNKALRSGVEKGEFAQPKGPSGTVKLAKKDAAKPAPAKKAAPKSEKASKAPAAKKAAPKKASTKAAAPKKATTTKKAAKPKANTSSKRKTPAAAPAIVPEEKILGKTKSGRVTKGPAKPAAKKAAPKKTPAKKAATPKKAAAAS